MRVRLFKELHILHVCLCMEMSGEVLNICIWGAHTIGFQGVTSSKNAEH